MLAGGAGGLQEVVQQAACGGVAVGGRAGGGQGAGVLADQVVEPVAAPGGLDQEVMVIQALQVPAGLGHRDAGQRRGGVGVEVAARVQAQAAEHCLLRRGQVLVGPVERGGDRPVLGVHQ